ncbi:F0F1 ATP synthase subunit gamma [Parabacteroides sp. FAFU027]|uniref:F0F1 ATP synthase subunit gamma n=1 Tax=Parabacteroides sp. FAFU027 TaxID=2922715 RepID=UPI001FAFE579|nr:F0F1 ATP synthase subunit gamma [Parabacteroides sp. FAFU027]
MDTLESLRRKLEGAGKIKSVVRTMKAVAASNIGQYESAVSSLGDYFRTVELGILAYFREEKITRSREHKTSKKEEERTICAIVLGSDQGLVGQFNDTLADYVIASLREMQGKQEVWAVGERVQFLLADSGLNLQHLFAVPQSVKAITPLVAQLLNQSELLRENSPDVEIYLYHNQPKPGAGYTPTVQRWLPLDETWRDSIAELHWPSGNLPEVIGGKKETLAALIREYLFVSLFKALAESLMSENASRLAAMQRAEKNIDELLDDLQHKFHSLRQSLIDEELFDVVSGFEALKNEEKREEDDVSDDK